MMFVVEPSYKFFFSFMFNGELDDDDLTLHVIFYVNQTLSQLNAGWRYSAQITQTEIID